MEWKYYPKTKELFFDGYPVDMENFVVDSVDWLRHLRDKVWFTREVEFGFLQSVSQILKEDPSLGRKYQKHYLPLLGDFEF